MGLYWGVLIVDWVCHKKNSWNLNNLSTIQELPMKVLDHNFHDMCTWWTSNRCWSTIFQNICTRWMSRRCSNVRLCGETLFSLFQPLNTPKLSKTVKYNLFTPKTCLSLCVKRRKNEGIYDICRNWLY